MSKQIDFVVRGNFDFPVDMLRFDECWPVDPESAAAILGDGTREISLRGMRCTPKRWESFLFKVVQVNGIEPPANPGLYSMHA